MTRPPSVQAARLLLGLLAALVVLGPALLGLDPYALDPARVYAGPSAAHLLGTDDLGRDVLARLLAGGRVSIGLGLAGGAACLGLGGGLGLIAGWRGGLTDRVVMGLGDLVLSLPRLPLMLILAAVDLGRVCPRLAGALGEAAPIAKLFLVVLVFGWVGAARLARASARTLRAAEFVVAARALGASELRILTRHVLPHAVSPLLVSAPVEVGEIIVYESVLSFLGLGVQPPVPSWGAMLSGGLTYLHTAPALVVLPGLLTALVVLALTVVTEDARDRRARSDVVRHPS